MEFSRKRNGRFPCGDCKKSCVNCDCLKCSECMLWYHSSCQSLSHREFTEWSDIELDFICQTCRTVSGSFDYSMAMERLRKAALMKDEMKLVEAVKREMLLKPVLDIPDYVPQDSDYPEVDAIAAEVIDNYSDDVTGDPVKTTGNGDCLFNAASILLVGNENLSLPLRYHTCLNLVSNRNVHICHPLRSAIATLSSSYGKTCQDSATVGAFSNTWTVTALADVIQMPIRVVYPYANGKNDLAYKTLNTTFVPREVRENARRLCILWYKMGSIPRRGNWYAVDHFAAVTNVKDILRNEKSPTEGNPPIWISPKKTSRPVSEKVLADESETYSTNRFDCLSSEESDDEMNDSSDDQHNDEQDNTPHTNNNRFQDAPHCEKLPGNNFLSNETAFNLLLKSSPEISSIPRGNKTNAYVVINYEQNEKRNEFFYKKYNEVAI